MNEDQRDAIAASDAWLEAAVSIAVLLRIHTPQGTGRDFWVAHHNLMMLARAQYACELAYTRLRETDLEIDQESSQSKMEVMLRKYLEAHSFLVSAHLYWKTLSEIESYLSIPELEEAVRRNADVMQETKTARDHIEHVNERIEIGRTKRFGDPMDADSFRRAMGRIEGGQIVFGDEEFDLTAIYRAIKQAGIRVAPQVKTLANEESGKAVEHFARIAWSRRKNEEGNK